MPLLEEWLPSSPSSFGKWCWLPLPSCCCSYLKLQLLIWTRQRHGGRQVCHQVWRMLTVPNCGCMHCTLICFFFQMYIGNNDISSQCKKMHAFKSICVQCPLNLQMTVMTKLVLFIGVLCQSTFSIVSACTKEVAVKSCWHISFCRCKYRAVSQQLCGLLAKPCVFLRELLLLAGDIEPNPGPVQGKQARVALCQCIVYRVVLLYAHTRHWRVWWLWWW